jgi:aminopeptidase N
MDIHYYDIFIDVDMEKKFFNATTTAFFELHEPTTEVALHLVNQYKVTGVFTVGGKKLKFSHDDHLIRITSKEQMLGFTSVQVVYEGQPPVAPNAPWVGGVTWEMDAEGYHWVGVSCPNEGSKVFFPSKDHPSDRADSVAINIRVAEPYYVAANGVLESTSTADGKTTFQWKTRYPVSNYNINFTIGNLVPVTRTFTTSGGHEMPVTFYVNAIDLDKAENHLDIAIENLNFHEKYFGEYPFYKEKFGLAHTSYLGMEHQTINAYGNHFIYDSIRGKKWDWLMLHEMGHEWWANKVTIEDWSDYWIHEGITSYADALYVNDRFGIEAYHTKIAKTGNGIANEKPIIPGRNADTDLVYQGDIYSKGAYLMHTLRFMMGDEAFFKALKAYAMNPGNTYANFATTDQFIEFFSSYTNVRIAPYIQMHLYTTDLMRPVVNKVGENQYEILLGLPFEVPVDVEIDGKMSRLVMYRTIVTASQPPVVDPLNWYLKAK